MEEEAGRIVTEACGPVLCPDTLADIALELLGPQEA
jgi:hypothetical protein